MEPLTNSNVMAQSHTAWYVEILEWLKDNAIVWTSLILGWKAIDRGFKYLSDGRVSEIRQIVQEEIGKDIVPEIKRLSQSIDGLKESIWEIKK